MDHIAHVHHNISLLFTCNSDPFHIGYSKIKYAHFFANRIRPGCRVLQKNVSLQTLYQCGHRKKGKYSCKWISKYKKKLNSI